MTIRGGEIAHAHWHKSSWRGSYGERVPTLLTDPLVLHAYTCDGRNLVVAGVAGVASICLME